MWVFHRFLSASLNPIISEVQIQLEVEQFDIGDAKTKTYVLSKLGSNLEIRDRKLHISGESPYFLIERGKNEITNIVEALEPEERAVISSNLLAYEPISSTLLGGLDSNQDYRVQSAMSYR